MSYAAEQKDHYRVANIYGRAQGDYSKVLQLARNMAKAIKDPKKACRRGDAAWNFEWHGFPTRTADEVARIFYMRAIEGLNDARARHEWDNKLNSFRHASQRTAPAPEPAPSAEPVERGPSNRKIKL